MVGWLWIVLVGVIVGIVGGLIGFGGVEFCFLFLIGMFGFVVFDVVILNKVISLIVVVIVLLFWVGIVFFD